MRETADFIDRLEAYLLDDIGDIASIRDEVILRLEEYRFLGDDEAITVLEGVRDLLDASDSPDDTDVLPLIFSLRERLTDAESAAETPPSTSHVEFLVPDDDSDLYSVGDEGELLLREAQHSGSNAYVIRIVTAGGVAERVVELLESLYAVVTVATTDDGVIRALVAASTAPKPSPLLESTLGDVDGGFSVEVRNVDFEAIFGTNSVARSWYDRVAPVQVTPRYETVERINVLLRELERSQSRTDDPVWHVLRESLDQSLTVDLRGVFNEMRDAVVSIGRDLDKYVTVKVGGDTDSVPAAYADLLRENVFELIVNAIEHGIETQTEREQQEKPPYGTVHILLRQTVGRLIIKVHDDGRGVDQDEIKRAFARGAGGGLSRVRSSVAQRFGGKLSLKTGERGTTAEIDIPFGRDVYRAVVFQRHDEYFVAPATFVVATPDLRPGDIMTDAADAPYIRFGGRMLPFVEADEDALQSLLGATAPVCVVLKVGSDEFAVAADTIVTESHVVPQEDHPNTVLVPGIDDTVTRIPLLLPPSVRAT